MTNLPDIRVIEAAHKFPGPFSFKAIGPNHDAFTESVCAAAIRVTGDESRVEATCRASAKGKHVSVTLQVQCDSARQVLDIYAELQTLADLKMLL